MDVRGECVCVCIRVYVEDRGQCCLSPLIIPGRRFFLTEPRLLKNCAAKLRTRYAARAELLGHLPGSAAPGNMDFLTAGCWKD